MRNTTPSIPLTEAVDLYTVGSENVDRKYYIDLLIHAKWAWKQLFWTTLYSVKSKIVPVTRVGEFLSYIPYPTDMARFYNICIEDGCNGLRAMMMDAGINTLPVPEIPAIGACSQCGQHDELAGCLQDFTLTTQDIIISGITYIEKTWKKLMPNGDVLEVKTSPVEELQADGTWVVKMMTTEKLIAQLEMKPCGCVSDTQINRFRLISQCGCAGILPVVQPTVRLLSKPYQKWGAVKLEGGKIWISGRCPQFVMLCYQSNGECAGEEIMIPEIAVDALQYGIDYLCKRFSPRVGRLEKQGLKNIWEEAKDELLIFLNPIREEDFLDSQMSIPMWGNAGTGCRDEYCLPEPAKPASQPKPVKTETVSPPAIPAAPVDNTQPLDNMTAINETYEVAANGIIKPGDVVFVLTKDYVIKRSINVEVDGTAVPELATTRRLACTITYTQNQVTIVFNSPLAAEQVVHITGMSYTP